ncbi:MAG: hypothetical protein M3458_04780 [Acidobacteriota bacterium]|nr:hypothetical protein [Acidobacteriota bacterium]
MRVLLFFLTILIFLIPLSVKTKAQYRETKSKDVRLVKNQPSVYLSFEREGKREPLEEGESGQGIWLRFRNNSKWQVGVCIFSVPKEYGDEGVFYEVERFISANTGNVGETPIGYEAKGGCLRQLIPPGKSLIFSVPREHLADGLAIKVAFRYEWEDNTNVLSGREPIHHAYFYSTDLAKK